MKIGIDVSQVVYQGTGVATYIKELVYSLLLYDPQNEYVLFGSSLRRYSELIKIFNDLPQKQVQYKFHHFPPTILHLLFNKLHILNIEKLVGKVDVFHTTDWTEPPSKIPKVTTIHDLIIYKYPEYLNSRIVEVQKQKLKWVIQESQAVIADSISTKNDIIHYLHIPESRISVIYLGVNPEFVPQAAKKIIETKKRYNIEGNYILCVGTREPRKNLHRIIAAYNSLNPKNYRLVIVGNPGWGQDVVSSKEIQVVNFVNRTDLPALYSGSSCFVYPSIYEGFGLPVLEAFASGACVVTSCKGSLGEIAKDHAVVVNPESIDEIAAGIKKVLNFSSTVKEDTVKKARLYASKFTWEETAKKTLEVYKSII